MKDVSRKTTTLRTATASSSVIMSDRTLETVKRGDVPKGDPIPVARTAGIMAAKDASRFIPYCHPLRVDHVALDFRFEKDRLAVTCRVTAVDRTGVEMEALVGATIAALTVYDMLKPIDDSLVIGETRLDKKKGGKSDFSEAFDRPIRAAVLVVSDSAAAGRRMDGSGSMIQERLAEHGVQVVTKSLVPDEKEEVKAALAGFVDQGLDLVVTTGGTGLGPRDITPEATAEVVERQVPGIAEAARTHGFLRTPRAPLSRGVAGVVGNTLIINLPGSTKGVSESLDALLPGVLHAFPMLWGGGHG